MTEPLTKKDIERAWDTLKRNTAEGWDKGLPNVASCAWCKKEVPMEYIFPPDPPPISLFLTGYARDGARLCWVFCSPGCLEKWAEWGEGFKELFGSPNKRGG